ncbi:hypothetical protein Skr01_34580 [Sphaerisporangium krabiense]|nr:hypothetical protein Skr01_34580 [Sphaerisporangium krabiense]
MTVPAFAILGGPARRIGGGLLLANRPDLTTPDQSPANWPRRRRTTMGGAAGAISPWEPTGSTGTLGVRRREHPPGQEDEMDIKGDRRWKDFSPRQRAAILALASVELALTSTAVVDLWARPAEQVRGRKALWWLAVFVQPVGPIAYLTLGRRR